MSKVLVEMHSMETKPYSKRELDHFIQELASQIRESAQDLSKQLDRIEIQTMKTNGRVSKLELWKQWITGGSGVLTLVVVPLFGWVLYEVATLPKTIQIGINNALAQYEVQVEK
jgi:hypothetical protein